MDLYYAFLHYLLEGGMDREDAEILSYYDILECYEDIEKLYGGKWAVPFGSPEYVMPDDRDAPPVREIFSGEPIEDYIAVFPIAAA